MAYALLPDMMSEPQLHHDTGAETHMLGRVYTFERDEQTNALHGLEVVSSSAVNAIVAAINDQPGIRFEELTDADNPRPVIVVLFAGAKQMQIFRRADRAGVAPERRACPRGARYRVHRFNPCRSASRGVAVRDRPGAAAPAGSDPRRLSALVFPNRKYRAKQ